jgi:adenosylcobinamide kinase/adenosylcobinamide-phosphate guanylyltransferase
VTHVASRLVIGAARSGKSSYAQTLAETAGGRCLFIATAEPLDAEMTERIARHKAARGSHWQTAEVPYDLPAALVMECAPDRVCLVDCLTLWLSNMLFRGDDLDAAGAALAAVVPRLEGPVIFVTNEVGAGIVPGDMLSRRFRDAQGRLNQLMAGACEAVDLVVAGLPLALKPAIVSNGGLG